VLDTQVCLQYVKTYTPLFDCRARCEELLSKDCLFMLSQDCENLCYGVHSEQCANKELYQIATGKDAGSPRSAGGSGWLGAALAATLALTAVLAPRP
jgi:hypothetical protein